MDLQHIGLISFQLIILAVMMAGLLSLFIIIVPGLVIIWIAAVVYAIVTGINWVSGLILFFITVLMITGNLSDNVLISAGAKSKGASWFAVGGALLAGVAGSILWPPIGGILAALGGLFLVELIRLRHIRTAYESARGMVLGCGWALAVRLTIAGIMILWWVLWVAFEWFVQV
jgi:uncharacterized protein YqgC (DUF456 family)